MKKPSATAFFSLFVRVKVKVNFIFTLGEATIEWLNIILKISTQHNITANTYHKNGNIFFTFSVQATDVTGFPSDDKSHNLVTYKQSLVTYKQSLVTYKQSLVTYRVWLTTKFGYLQSLVTNIQSLVTYKQRWGTYKRSLVTYKQSLVTYRVLLPTKINAVIQTRAGRLNYVMDPTKIQ